MKPHQLPNPASVNGRSVLQDVCNAATKAGGLLAVCDLLRGHEHEHEALLTNGQIHRWEDEPW